MKSLKLVGKFLVISIILATFVMSLGSAEGEVPFPYKVYRTYEVSLGDLIKFQNSLSTSGLTQTYSTSNVELTWRKVLHNQWGNMILAAGGSCKSRCLGDDETHVVTVRTRQVGNGLIRLTFELDCFCDKAKGAKTVGDLVKLFDENFK